MSRRILQDMKVRNLARKSWVNYISQGSRFACQFGLQCDNLGTEHIHKQHAFHKTGGKEAFATSRRARLNERRGFA